MKLFRPVLLRIKGV